MAAERTVLSFLDHLRASGLLSDGQLDELSRCPEASDPAATPLARAVFQRGWLTRFQLSAIAAGRATDLTTGPYTLLDRLGEGGMGTVYKALHQHLRRVVALKVIRKDRLANSTAVSRFYQEARLVAALSHPNIVLAYDAGQAGNVHYFAMEYVEGIDLSRLVKEQGPLPLPLACEYIRQAALGLQHAHEKGLVHRDVKPSNLLVSRPPDEVVKILDLGLARLRRGDDTALTRAGFTVGTADYMAPEQALNSRAADIRADLYSLGCTLLYLLTGKPPFAGGELTEVLLRHQIHKAASLADCGVEAPAAVQAIIDKLLAKDPDDRYQTPAELAEEMVPVCGAEALAGAAFRIPRGGESSGAGGWGKNSLDATREQSRPVLRAGRGKANKGDDKTLVDEAVPNRKRVRALAGAGVAGALLALVLLGGVLYWKWPGPADDRARAAVTEPEPTEHDGLPPPPHAENLRAKPPDRGANLLGVPAIPGPRGQVAAAESGQPALPPKPKANTPTPDQPAPAAQKGPFEGHAGEVLCAAFSPDGKKLLSGGSDRTVRLWDVATGKELKVLKRLPSAISRVGFAGRGARAVAIAADSGFVTWDLETGKIVREIGWTGKRSGALAADGELVLFPQGDGVVHVQATTDSGQRDRHFTNKTWGRCLASDFSPDGGFAVFATSADGLLHVCDLTTKKEKGPGFPGPREEITCLAVAPRETHVLIADAKSVTLWSLQTFKLTRSLVGHTDRIRCLAFSPDGQRAVTGGADAIVRLWDVVTGKELKHSSEHKAPVGGVAFSPDGQWVVSCGDGIKRWDLRKP